MLKKYGLDSNNSIQYVLGLNIPEIINKLKQLVHEKFTNTSIFQGQKQVVNSKLANAKKKEVTLRHSLKRDQEKLIQYFIKMTKIVKILFTEFKLNLMEKYYLRKKHKL